MINIIFYFFTGTISFLTFTSCVYSLTYPKNLLILKNNKNNKNIIIENNDDINIGITEIPFQKIFFLNSNKVINIYKNYYANDTNIFILKLEDFDDNFIIVKSSDEFDDTMNLEQNNFSFCKDLFEKKLITISPGGLYGYYDAGICSVIKNNYNLNKYIFSGASAGAWNSLFMSYKYNPENLLKNILNINNDFTSIKNLQTILKEKILKFHKSEEFDLKKIFITVCVWDKFGFQNHIYTDFVDLEDAIDCCVASSNIPFVTGNLIHKYRNKIAFDGGFLTQQYIGCKNQYFNINNKMWGLQLVAQNLIFLDNLYIYNYFFIDLFTLLYFLNPFIFAI